MNTANLLHLADLLEKSAAALRAAHAGLATLPKTEESTMSLGLSVLPRKALRKLGIDTISALIEKTPGDLLSVKNFGPVALQEIKEKLAARGLALRDDNQW